MKLITNLVESPYYNYKKNYNNSSSTKIDYKTSNNDTFELSFNGYDIKNPKILGDKFFRKLMNLRKPSFFDFVSGKNPSSNIKEFKGTPIERFVANLSTEKESGEYKYSTEDIKSLCNLNQDLLGLIHKIYPKYKHITIKELIEYANKYLRSGLADNPSFLANPEKYMRGYLSVGESKINNRIKWHNEKFKLLDELINIKDDHGKYIYGFSQIDKLLQNKNGEKIHKILTMRDSNNKLKFDVTPETRSEFINKYNANEQIIDKFIELDPQPRYKNEYLETILEYVDSYYKNEQGYDYVIKNAPEMFKNHTFTSLIDNENYTDLIKIFNDGNKALYSYPELSAMLNLYKVNAKGTKYYMNLTNSNGQPTFSSIHYSKNVLDFLISKNNWNDNTKNLITNLAKKYPDLDRILQNEEESCWLKDFIALNNKKPRFVEQMLEKYNTLRLKQIANIMASADKNPKTIEFVDKLGKRLNDVEQVEDFVKAYEKDPEFVTSFIQTKNLDSDKYRVSALNFAQGRELKILVDARAIDKDFVDSIISKINKTKYGDEYYFGIFDSEDLLEITKKHKQIKYQKGIDLLLNSIDDKSGKYYSLSYIRDKIDKYNTI